MRQGPSAIGKRIAHRTGRFIAGFMVCLVVFDAFTGTGFAPSIAHAEESSSPAPPVLDAARQYAFAEYRMKNGQYAQAVDEFERFLFWFPEDRRGRQAMFEIGMAHFFGGMYRDAISSFQRVIQTHPDSDTAFRSWWMIGRSHIRIGEIQEGVVVLNRLAESPEHRDIQQEAYYEMAWANLEIAGKTHDPDVFSSAVKESLRLFGKIEGDDPRLRLAVDQTVNGLCSDNGSGIKSPHVAGVLSILPGAGHLYLGRYQDALIAFFLNAGLAFASVEAFDRDQPVLGSLLGVASFGFYAGNFYSAVSSAHKANRNRNRRFINTLKENAVFRFSMDPESDRSVLHLDVAF